VTYFGGHVSILRVNDLSFFPDLILAVNLKNSFSFIENLCESEFFIYEFGHRKSGLMKLRVLSYLKGKKIVFRMRITF